MFNHLAGLRVVEGASFIAAPSCGLYLAQLGAEVIRFDQIGGGPDFRRWPKTDNGASLYWEGLNKAKKSIAIDLKSPEGRELALRLATAPGPGAGIFLTNYPANGFLAHERLRALRADQISVRVMGQADGTGALDYTVNCAVGIPQMTGSPDSERPVNHVLPAWDLLAGSTAALSLLAAERRRSETGAGEEVRVPLGDVAVAALGNLGQIGEVATSGRDRPRTDNDIFGAFGRDFVTADGRRIMIAALTPRHWKGLVDVLGIAAAVAGIEDERGVSFARDEGLRFEHREALNPLVAAAVASRPFDELTADFDAAGVCWGPYQTLREAVNSDPRLVGDNPLFATIPHPSGATYPAPGFPAGMSGEARAPATRAPFLGEHTEQVLAECLSCSAGEISGLHDRGVVASHKRA